MLKNVFVNNSTNVATTPLQHTHNINFNTSHDAHHAKTIFNENKTLCSFYVIFLYASKLC